MFVNKLSIKILYYDRSYTSRVHLPGIIIDEFCLSGESAGNLVRSTMFSMGFQSGGPQEPMEYLEVRTGVTGIISIVFTHD